LLPLPLVQGVYLIDDVVNYISAHLSLNTHAYHIQGMLPFFFSISSPSSFWQFNLILSFGFLSRDSIPGITSFAKTTQPLTQRSVKNHNPHHKLKSSAALGVDQALLIQQKRCADGWEWGAFCALFFCCFFICFCYFGFHFIICV
jgi:hypothetical protein